MAAKSPAHLLLPNPTAVHTCPRQRPGRGGGELERGRLQKRVGFSFSILGVGVGVKLKPHGTIQV